MPWRMPNWKMRANADDDGMPTTRLCRMPSFGCACIMRTSLHDRDPPDIRLSASSGQHQFVVAAPALAEIADVAGLEAGVVGAAAIGDAVAVAFGGLPVRDALLLGGANGRIIGVGQDEIAERCRPGRWRRRWP